jgi:hypothetical protein
MSRTRSAIRRSGPGDTIMLMSGNYGDIGLGDYNLPTTNSDFITIEAAPGQTPVFNTLYVARTNKWVFNGIKVESRTTRTITGRRW